MFLCTGWAKPSLFMWASLLTPVPATPDKPWGPVSAQGCGTEVYELTGCQDFSASPNPPHLASVLFLGKGSHIWQSKETLTDSC